MFRVAQKRIFTLHIFIQFEVISVAQEKEEQEQDVTRMFWWRFIRQTVNTMLQFTECHSSLSFGIGSVELPSNLLWPFYTSPDCTSSYLIKYFITQTWITKPIPTFSSFKKLWKWFLGHDKPHLTALTDESPKGSKTHLILNWTYSKGSQTEGRKTRSQKTCHAEYPFSFSCCTIKITQWLGLKTVLCCFSFSINPSHFKLIERKLSFFLLLSSGEEWKTWSS